MPTRRDFHKLSIAAALAALPGVGAAQSVLAASSPAPVRRRRGDALGTVRPEVYGTHGVVAAGTQYTVEAGRRILAAGGNAFDAGVAAVLAAAVNEFSHFGMGGEAPAIVCEAATGKVTVVCGQGTAPKAATPAYFMDAGVIPGNGPNGGTVPAVIDSMALSLQNFGTMSLAQVMAPALELADGFPMYGMLRYTLEANRENTERWEWGKRTYYPEGRIAEIGEVFRQPNLAKTLRALVAAERAAIENGASREKAIEAGRDAFYKGDIARRIAAAVQADGGLMTYEDLATYRGALESATSTQFQGYEVYKAGFWSQGPTLLMALNILDAAGIAGMRHGGEQYLHTLIEAIKLAFDDRNAWFGDPRFADIPAEGLLSRAYAAERASLIGSRASLQHRYGNPYAHQRSGKAPASVFVPHQLQARGGPPNDTTAIEIVDARGNLFSATPSSGWLMGGAYIAGDTGVPLSNRMTVFDLDPASPNVLAGGKRPRTTLTPTIVTRGGKPFLAVGTPGGDSQDQQILQTLLNIIMGGHSLQQAIEAPRLESMHFHQSFDDKRDAPGMLEIEGRIPTDVLFGLERRGHLLEVRGPYGISTAGVAVGIDPDFGTLRGGADIRGLRQAFGW
ncbi:MAG: gamma-glutamyltransferase family protein [Steroidobacteraceae bacterium]